MLTFTHVIKGRVRSVPMPVLLDDGIPCPNTETILSLLWHTATATLEITCTLSAMHYSILEDAFSRSNAMASKSKCLSHLYS